MTEGAQAALVHLEEDLAKTGPKCCRECVQTIAARLSDVERKLRIAVADCEYVHGQREEFRSGLAALQHIAQHLARCGPRAGISIWVAGAGFAGRVDMRPVGRGRLPVSSPVFFADTAEEVIARLVQRIREDQ